MSVVLFLLVLATVVYYHRAIEDYFRYAFGYAPHDLMDEYVIAVHLYRVLMTVEDKDCLLNYVEGHNAVRARMGKLRVYLGRIFNYYKRRDELRMMYDMQLTNPDALTVRDALKHLQCMMEAMEWMNYGYY